MFLAIQNKVHLTSVNIANNNQGEEGVTHHLFSTSTALVLS